MVHVLIAIPACMSCTATDVVGEVVYVLPLPLPLPHTDIPHTDIQIIPGMREAYIAQENPTLPITRPITMGDLRPIQYPVSRVSKHQSHKGGRMNRRFHATGGIHQPGGASCDQRR